MSAETASTFKLCSIATLPEIDQSQRSLNVRILGRVVGSIPNEGMCLVVDPATSPAPSIVVDFTEVIVDGGIPPPKVKDLVMVFGELISRNLNSNQTPRNELSVLNVLSPRTTRVLAAKRLVRIEEGPGTGFDVNEWAQTVKTVESHVAAR